MSQNTKKVRVLFWVVAVGIFLSLGETGFSQNNNSTSDRMPAANRLKGSSGTGSTSGSGSKKGKAGAAKPTVNPDAGFQQALQKALELAKMGNYTEATVRVHRLARLAKTTETQMQLKYLTGLMLYDLKLYQTAAFYFLDVVREGSNKYVKRALEKLSLAANLIHNDSLLNYALSKINLEEFPKAHHDMLNFRLGEIYAKQGDFERAVSHLSKVSVKSGWYSKAKYLEGTTYAEAKQLDKALNAFNTLMDARYEKAITDRNKVAAQLGVARVLYQKGNWDAALDAYHQIPRDTEMWHDALFEMTWGDLRAAKFRSVLSNLHSLHSPYYEDFYNPESVLLRGLVYLFICQYDEMGKTLDFFEEMYQPVLQNIAKASQELKDPLEFYEEIAKVQQDYQGLRKSKARRVKNKIPFIVSRYILKEGDVLRTTLHINELMAERNRIQALPRSWRETAVGGYAERVINSRLDSAKKFAGQLIQAHLIRVQKDLEQLFEQHGFARYEMLKGKKEDLKKKLAGKGLLTQVDQDTSRSYYIQNGYEYWPFDGEYWLDEIGNFQYVGVQSCDSVTQ